MTDDVSRDIFAFIDQEKEKAVFSYEDEERSDWRNQSASTVSDWLVSSHGYFFRHFQWLRNFVAIFYR